MNIDQVIAVEMVIGGSAPTWNISTVNGEVLVASMDKSDMMALPGHIVPADPGTWIYIIGHLIRADRPTLEHVVAQRETVVAWLFPADDPKCPTPLLPTGIEMIGHDWAEDHEFLLPTPDGRLKFQ